MAPQLSERDKLIRKALDHAWVLGLGAVLFLIGLVLLLNHFTPHPLGH